MVYWFFLMPRFERPFAEDVLACSLSYDAFGFSYSFAGIQQEKRPLVFFAASFTCSSGSRNCMRNRIFSEKNRIGKVQRTVYFPVYYAFNHFL